MKSSKKITTLLLTLLILVLSLGILSSCGSTVTVSFESDGGSSVRSVTLNAGEALQAPNPPTRDGYSFAGWYTESGVAWDFDTPVNDDITLVAKWVKNDGAKTAKLKLDLQGGAIDGELEMLVVKGSVISAPKTPTKRGYEFAGWSYLNSDFSFQNTAIAEDMTIVAKWRAVVYEISYELSGAALADAPSSYTVLDTLAINNPEKPGYDFVGWTFGGIVEPEKSLVINPGEAAEDLTLTAHFLPAVYTISYELSGGEFAYPRTSYTTLDESFTIPSAFLRHYDFLGWSYTEGGEIFAELTINKGSYGDITLYANFKPTEYQVVYELGEGGVNNEQNPTKTGIESEAAKILAPTRPGYVFTGWIYDGSTEPVLEYTIPAKTAKNIKLTATWEIGTYNVTYYENNGAPHGELISSFIGTDTLPIKLPDLYLNNKCFISWYTDPNFVTPIYEITEYKDITLYAKFVDKTSGLVFTYADGSYTLTSYNGTDGTVYIPEIYEGLPVTKIANGAFIDNETIEEIYIPLSVISIGDEAFLRAENLRAVYIDSDAKLETIGKYAFSSTAISTFEAPALLAAIKVGAFASCKNLTEITFGENEALTSIEAYAFKGSALVSITLPESLVSIGEEAFYANVNLKSVSFGDESLLASIGTKAFFNCTSLKEITIPAGVTVIEESTFEDCKALVNLYFAKDSKLSSISAKAFKNAKLLSSVEIPAYTVEIGESAFENAYALKSVSFVKNGELRVIGASAFRSCSSLEEFSAPKKLYEISEFAFLNCSSLRTAEFNDTLSVIANGAFKNCSALSAINLSKNTLNIGLGAFEACSSVEAITIARADDFTSIFAGTLPTKVKSLTVLGGDAFERGAFSAFTSLESINLPFAGLYDIGALISADGESTVYADKTSVGSFVELFATEDGISVPETLKTVVISGGSYIAESSFAGAKSIKTLTISRDVTEIGYGAFSGCSGLESISLALSTASGTLLDEAREENTKTLSYLFAAAVPQSLKSITVYSYGTLTAESLEDNAFVGSSLEKVTLVGFNGISNGAFFGVSTLKELDLNKSTVEFIGNSAFEGCKALKEFTVETSVTSIGERAFASSGLTSIVFEYDEVANPEYTEDSELEKTLKIYYINSIGKEAFHSAKSLSDVIIPSTITEIKDGTFTNCESLSYLYLPEAVESIGVSAFENCTLLREIELASETELSVISEYAFKNSAIESLVIPCAVSRISKGAFENCKSLITVTFKKFTIHDTRVALVVEEDAFRSSSIKEIALPSYLVAIEANAFRDCNLLSEISFGNAPSLSSIGVSAFENCTSLTKIAIPGGVETIVNSSFKNCKSLTEVIFGEDSVLNKIEAYAFFNCQALKAFTLNSDVTEIAEFAFAQCYALASFKLEDASALSVLANNAFENCTALISISLPASLSTIGESAFSGCLALEKVDISKTKISVIPENAFRECESLKAIAIPASVSAINDYAFYSCALLAKLDLLGTSRLETIGVGAFKNCKALKSFSAPLTLKTIKLYAFENCEALESFSFTTRTTLIEDYAFRNCSNLVFTVFYSTEAEIESFDTNYSEYWNSTNREIIFRALT